MKRKFRKSIRLDRSKLLGFDQIAGDDENPVPGGKIGLKPNRMVARIGGKVGIKLKVG